MIDSGVFRASPPQTRLQEWRGRILQTLLYVLLVLGTVMYVANVLVFIRNQNWLIIAAVSLAYIMVAVVTFLRGLPYELRAGTVLAAAFALGPLALNLYGLGGDGRVWLLFFILFSGLLFNRRVAVAAALLSTVTYAVTAWLFTSGVWPPPTDLVTRDTNASSWVNTGITLVFVITVLAASLDYLIQGFSRSIRELEDTLTAERKLREHLSLQQTELADRSSDLERRLLQIRTAAEISRAIGTILDPQELLQRVADLILERFELYYVGVFLVDDRGRYANLTAGTGEAGRRMLADEHRLSVGGSSMVGWATANRQPRIALDVGADAIRFRNPHLPHTRSELALPIALGNQVLGALSIQSDQPAAFDQDDVTVLQGIADSLAVALENARLFQQIETSLNEIRQLNRDYVEGSWTRIARGGPELFATFENPAEAGDDSPSYSLNIPLTLREQQIIGNITLETENSNWSSEELEFVEAVGNQAALALESARLLEETQRRAEREQALNELTSRFARTLDFESLMQTVVRELGQLPKVSEVSIHVVPPTDEDTPGPQPAELGAAAE
ncbi:MAG: GAF domain-containing protein [Chloroflexi bacterium]|nr:GAF domain-containing protein [Chloroflexota bacterium]